MDREVVTRTESRASHKAWRSPLRITLGYVVFAVLWILASDWALFAFVPDPAYHTLFSQLKGLGFVAVTGLFLYLLLRAGDVAGPSAVSDAADSRINRLVNPRFVLGAFIGLSATILITSYFVTSHINLLIREEKFDELNAIADLKADEIERWIDERWSDANVFAGDRGFGDRIHRWFDLGDNAQRDRVVTRLQAVRSSNDYESVLLYDARGRLRLVLGESHGNNPRLERLVNEAVKSRTTQFSDLYRDVRRPDHLHLDFVMPLAAGSQDKLFIAGVIVLRVDPTRYLYGQIQRWPLQAQHGESLIVRREGDEVLFLSELRYHPGSGLTLRMPVTTPGLPAALAVQGEIGTFEGTDYRDVPVFSVLRPIYGTPWYMIAKIDREEALAPTRHVQLVSATITLVAIMFVGLLVGLGWRQQVRNFALRQRMHESERQALTKHFEYLSRNVNDIHLLTDDDFKITEVNERATEITGYSRNDIIGSPLIKFRSVAARATAERDYAKIRNEEHARYESEIQLKDGGQLPVEVSAARVKVKGRNYYQFVIRDISERKRYDEQLRQSESTLRLFFDLSFIGMAITSAKTKRCLQVNQTMCDMLGYPREELLELNWAELTHPDDLPADVAQFERVLRREIDGYAMDKRFIRKDGQVVYVMIDVKCVRDATGEPDFFVATVADITKRKQAEDLRHAEEDRYLRQRNALISLSTSKALETDDLAAAFRRITETDAKTLGVARVSIWRYNRERTAILCVDLYELEAGRHSAGMELSATAYPSYFRALLEKDVIAADDAHRDPRTSEFSENYLHPLGITSMMDTHIQLGGVVDGVLCHEHVGPLRQWTSDEKTFAVAVASLVSLALEGWERKSNQEKLVAAAEQFQGLVEQSIAGIFIIVDGRFAYVNPRLAEILGYPPADLIGHDAVETIVESDRPIFRANLSLCLSGATESQQISYLCRRPDGSMVDVGSHMNRATHAGKPAVIGVVQDISDKKRAETKIQDYIRQLERGMLSTIKAVSVMSELRDPYTYGHEQRVGDLSGAIAAEMGLNAQVVKGLQIAGYVHDIGKIVVPAEILAKPSKLTKAEFELIKSHPEQGYEVLKNIDFPWPIAQVALQHHERLDGAGYPQGLKGDQIILEARILAVADVVEAMAAHRPYRPSRGIDAALEEVVKHRGVKYDPAAVDACVRLFRERGYVLEPVL